MHVACGVEFPYLHHGTDEHGQHSQRESEDVEKRDGSESLLSSQDVAWAHAHKHCKCDQRNLVEKDSMRKKKGTILHVLICRFLKTYQGWSTCEDEGGDRRQVGKLTHDLQFVFPNVVDLCLEGRLPCVQLQNLEGSQKEVGGTESIVDSKKKEGWGTVGQHSYLM